MLHDNNYKMSELEIKQNYLSCISKSPELMMADAKDQYLHYDDTMRELKGAIIQNQQPHQIHLKPIPSIPEPKQTMPQPKQSMSQPKQLIPQPKPIRPPQNTNRQEEPIPSQRNISVEPEHEKNEEDDDEYKKVDVRDLISSFEKQIRPVMRYKMAGDKYAQSAQFESPENYHETNEDYQQLTAQQITEFNRIESKYKEFHQNISNQQNQENTPHVTRFEQMDNKSHDVNQQQQLTTHNEMTHFESMENKCQENYSTQRQYESQQSQFSEQYSALSSSTTMESQQNTKVNYQNVCRGNYQKINQQKQIELQSKYEPQYEFAESLANYNTQVQSLQNEQMRRRNEYDEMARQQNATTSQSTTMESMQMQQNNYGSTESYTMAGGTSLSGGTADIKEEKSVFMGENYANESFNATAYSAEIASLSEKYESSAMQNNTSMQGKALKTDFCMLLLSLNWNQLTSH